MKFFPKIKSYHSVLKTWEQVCILCQTAQDDALLNENVKKEKEKRKITGVGATIGRNNTVHKNIVTDANEVFES